MAIRGLFFVTWQFIGIPRIYFAYHMEEHISQRFLSGDGSRHVTQSLLYLGQKSLISLMDFLGVVIIAGAFPAGMRH
jgi:hypothetical protein